MDNPSSSTTQLSEEGNDEIKSDDSSNVNLQSQHVATDNAPSSTTQLSEEGNDQIKSDDSSNVNLQSQHVTTDDAPSSTTQLSEEGNTEIDSDDSSNVNLQHVSSSTTQLSEEGNDQIDSDDSSNVDLQRQDVITDNAANYTKLQHYIDLEDTFRKLENLSENKNKPIFNFTNNQDKIEQLLNSNLSNDAIVLLIHILPRYSSVALTSKEIFHTSLQKFLFSLVKDKSIDCNQSYFWANPDGFFLNAVVVLEKITKHISSRVYKLLPDTLKLFNKALELVSSTDILDKLLNDVEKVERRIKAYGDKHDIEKDYYDLDVYPSTNEIYQNRIILKSNLIGKNYNSVDHYLDIQFRMLKENLIGPLRYAIVKYMQCIRPLEDVLEVSHVRIYTDVKFISTITALGQSEVVLQFQSKRWQNSQYFNEMPMRGSLLCFTMNNFQSMLFGIVLD
ncbi:hypothetical protein RN001_014955 [Aquatica leii]|uniref:ZNFX1 domain-containing protein n=1 Tax=Aquatica leii TaxID=1421715 RepID=A0AAN7S6F7_9COLE|nr:hypothetical protein RN001_014955 [Aquatica leii]